jgi:hypothetical protein
LDSPRSTGKKLGGATAICVVAAGLTLLPHTGVQRSWAETKALAGTWFAEGNDRSDFGTVFVQFIYDRRSDGLFFVRIRELDHCRPMRQWRESGTWDFVNGSIRQTTQFVDNQPSQFEDQYRVLSQSRDSISLLDLETGIKWGAVRVSPDFKFPPPKSCAVS